MCSRHKNQKTFGFTADKEGANLPHTLGPWTYWKPVDMSNPLVAGDNNAILDGLRERGYHVAAADLKMTETVVKRNA